MVTYASNIDLLKSLVQKLKELEANPAEIFKEAVHAVLPELRHRVHEEGKDSSGAQIGTYSPGYMALRTGAFKNAGKFSKGAKKGQNKDAGTFTDQTIRLNKNVGVFTGEDKVGTARPQYHRTSDTKVILSLTRQMENDMSVIATDKGYGIGYLNPDNYKKAIWAEATYKKKILTEITKEELELVKKSAEASLHTIISELIH